MMPDTLNLEQMGKQSFMKRLPTHVLLQGVSAGAATDVQNRSGDTPHPGLGQGLSPFYRKNKK